MYFEIDQSGKIEQTNLDTVIAFSDGGSFSILLKKSEKRKIKKYFCEHGFLKVYRQQGGRFKKYSCYQVWIRWQGSKITFSSTVGFEKEEES